MVGARSGGQLPPTVSAAPEAAWALAGTFESAAAVVVAPNHTAACAAAAGAATTARASSVLLSAKPISLSHRTAPAGRSTNTTTDDAIPASNDADTSCVRRRHSARSVTNTSTGPATTLSAASHKTLRIPCRCE